MPQYGDSQDVDIDVGVAVESANSESFSTPAANCAELLQSVNWVEESTNNHGYFSPTAEQARIFFFFLFVFSKDFF